MAQPGGEKRRGKPFDAAADDGDLPVGIRRLVRLNPAAALFFEFGGEPFEMIDGHRFVDQVAAAFILAGSRADSADHRGERIALFDHLNGAMIIADLDLADVFPDVDTGGAFPLAGRRAFIFGVFPEDTAGDGRKGDDMLRAYPLTGAAARAFHRIHDRKVVGPHHDGVKGTRPGAAAQPEASDGADLHAAAQKGNRAAVAHSVINIFEIRILGAEITSRPGDVRLLGLDRNPQNRGNGLGDLDARGHARVGSGLARHDGLGIGRTSGISASAAVGAGKYALHGFDRRIHPDVKDLGCNGQADAHDDS